MPTSTMRVGAVCVLLACMLVSFTVAAVQVDAGSSPEPEYLTPQQRRRQLSAADEARARGEQVEEKTDGSGLTRRIQKVPQVQPLVRPDGYGEDAVVMNVMSANLVSFRRGEVKKYGHAAARIIRALKPDIAGLQWFNTIHGRSEGAIRRYIDEAFGPGFNYVRDDNPEHLRPPAIVFRDSYKVIHNGTWDDPVVDERAMTWVKLQVHNTLPGGGDSVPYCDPMAQKPCDGHRDLHQQYLPTVAPRIMVVSALFSGNSQNREMQARFIARKLLWHYDLDDPADLAHSDECILILAEFDTYTSRSSQLMLLKQAGLMQEGMAPHDQEGNPYTDIDRMRRRTYIVSNKAMLVREVPYRIGSNTFPFGTVFDSRVQEPPLDGVEPRDSVADNIRRLPVMRRFEFRVNHREREYIREERRRLDASRRRLVGIHPEEVEWMP